MIKWVAKLEADGSKYEVAYIHGYKCVVWAADGEWWITVHDPEGDITSWGDGYASCTAALRAAEEHVRDRL